MDLRSKEDDLHQAFQHRHTGTTEILRTQDDQTKQFIEKESSWFNERQKFLAELQCLQEVCAQKDMELRLIHSKFELQKKLKEERDISHAALKDQLSKLHLDLDHANEQLEAREQDNAKLVRDLQQSSSSLTTVVEHNDAVVKQLKINCDDLESLLAKKEEENRACFLKVRILEQQIQEQQCNIEVLKDSREALKRQLDENVDELATVTKDREALEAEISDVQRNLNYEKLDLQRRVSDLKESCSVSAVRLQEALYQVEGLKDERGSLLRELENKESELAEARGANQSLLLRKTGLEDSVEALQEKRKVLDQELESRKSAVEQLCNSLEAAEAKLDNQSQEIKNLEVKLEAASRMNVELNNAEQKVKDLEIKLSEATALFLEKEEKLSASEWAVQQLANDVSKAKNSLVQKEKEEGILQSKLKDVEGQLRAKEVLLTEMECCIKRLAKKNICKQEEMDILCQAVKELKNQLTERKQKELELKTQIEGLNSSLEERNVAFSASQAEIKQKTELEAVMQGVIGSLKFQLSEQAKVSLDRECEVERLYEDLEKAKLAEKLHSDQLEVAQSNFMELDRNLREQIQKLQTTCSELQEELISIHCRQSNNRNELELVTGKLSTCTRKCCTLEEMLASKDKALKDMEDNSASLQRDLLEQMNLAEQRKMELNDISDQIRSHALKEKDFKECISHMRCQLQEKQLQNEQMEAEINRLNDKLDASSIEITLMSDEVKQLRMRVEHFEELSAEQNDLKDLVSGLRESLQNVAKVVDDRDITISDLRGSLKTSELQLQHVKECLERKTKAYEETLERLNSAEIESTELQDLVTRLEEELETAKFNWKHQTEKVSSLKQSIEHLETELFEYKERTTIMENERRAKEVEFECACQTIDSLNVELRASHENQCCLDAKVSRLNDALEDMRCKLMNETNNAILKEQSLTALETQLSAWKEKAYNALGGLETKIFELEGANKTIGDLRLQLDGQKEKHSKMHVNLTNAQSSLIQETGKVLSLELLVKSLRAEAEARQKNEESIAEGLNNAFSKVAEKENKNNELMDQIQAYKDKEAHMEAQFCKWNEQLRSAQLDLLEEMECVLSLDCPLIDLQANLLQWKDKFSCIVEHIKEIKFELATTFELIDQWNNVLVTFREASSDSQSILSLEVQLKEALTSLQEEKEKILNHLGLTAALQSELSQQKQALEFAVKEAEVRNLELEFTKTTILKLKAEHEEAVKKEDSMQNEVVTLRLTLESSRRELKEKNQKLNSCVLKLEKEVEYWKGILATAHEEREAAKSELEITVQVISDLKAQVAKITEEKDRAQAFCQKLKDELDLAHKDLLARKRMLQNVVAQLENSKKSRMDIQAKLHTEYQIILENLGIQEASKKYTDSENLIAVVREDCVLSTNKTIDMEESERYGSSDNDGVMAYKLQVPAFDLDVSQKRNNDMDRLAIAVKEAFMKLARKDQELEKLNAEIEALRLAVSKPKEGEYASAQLTCTNSKETDIKLMEHQANDGGSATDKVLQEEYYRYLELCDSLIRKNARLEKQMEGLRRKNHALQKQKDDLYQSITKLPVTGTLAEVHVLERTSGRSEQEEQRLCNKKIIAENLISSMALANGSLGTWERLPLQVLQCHPGNPVQNQFQKRKRSGNSEAEVL